LVALASRVARRNPKDPSPSIEEVLSAYLARKPEGLSPPVKEALAAYHALSPESQEEFGWAFMREGKSLIRRVVETLLARVRDVRQMEEFWLAIGWFLVRALHKNELTIAHRMPKPRNTDRDAEIVRLHDEEGLPFKKIPKALQGLNPAWANEKGEPLSKDAVERAYRRHKARPGDPGQMHLSP
jgi:hypothetical protein